MAFTDIRCGDVRDELRKMPDESVHCAVTSPPYWGLRDYGVAGQIGLEASLGEHIDMMVEVFREVRRVLRKDGTLWLNYGDAYACAPNGRSAADVKALGNDDRTFRDKPISTVGGVLKPKDRMLLPARLAIALCDDGWWVRDEIIWHKPNPMPSSVKDRTTPAHEMIYMLTKSARYHFDHAAIKTEATSLTMKKPDGWDTGPGAHGTRHRAGREKGEKTRGLTPRHEGHVNHTKLDQTPRGQGAAKRSVWTIAPKPFKEAHFATFPPDLIRPCILAGCPIGGTVLDPFFGAGTTGLVAMELGRNCIGIELNPKYVDIAYNRLGMGWMT